MYWASEAGTVAASRPQFREMKMDLEKMMGFAYATDEMLTDAAFMTGFFGSAFTLAADRLLTESVISGDGAGKPLGLLHSKALLAVDKESSQAAGTFTGANAIKMQARAMPRHRDRLAWLMHPDVEEQLPLSGHPERRGGQVPVEPRGRPGQLRYPAGAQQAGAV